MNLDSMIIDYHERMRRRLSQEKRMTWRGTAGTEVYRLYGIGESKAPERNDV